MLRQFAKVSLFFGLACSCIAQQQNPGLLSIPWMFAATGSKTVSSIKVDGFIPCVSSLTLGALLTTNDIYAHWYTNSANAYPCIVQFYVANNTQVTADTNGFAAPLPLLVGNTAYTHTATNAYAFPRSNPVNGLEVFLNKGGGSGVSNLVITFLIKNGSLATNSGNGAAPDLAQISMANGDTVYLNWHDYPGNTNEYLRFENFDLTGSPPLYINGTNQWLMLSLTCFATNQNNPSNYVTAYNPATNYNLIGATGYGVDAKTGADLRATAFVVGPYNAHGTFSNNQTSYVAAVWWRSFTNATTLGPGALSALPTADPAFMQWAKTQPDVMNLLAEMQMLKREDEGTIYQ